ncbi:hypothetical protein [Rhizobium sp.]
MNGSADTLSRLLPSAAPSDADLAAWEKLPREEQLQRLQSQLIHRDCSVPSSASMADIRDRARAAAKLDRG